MTPWRTPVKPWWLRHPPLKPHRPMGRATAADGTVGEDDVVVGPASDGGHPGPRSQFAERLPLLVQKQLLHDLASWRARSPLMQ
jgi:hypothetical protein